MTSPKTPGSQVRVPGAVIYTRVSTGEQDKHGTSPESQLAACRAKALALSLPIVAEHYDPGISGGFLLSRKEFQAALAAVQSGRADTLICPNISRYSRDVEHQQSVKKAVQAAGGRLVFCDMEFADTPEGDLNFTIQGGFAEYERKVIRKRLMEGRTRRALGGQQPARARSPFGYRIATKADVLRGAYPPDAVGKYQVVEEEAQVIREVFARYAAGADTLNGLCKWLNGAGVKPGGGAGFWWPSRISYILKNAVYKGVAVYGQRVHRTDEGRLQQTNPQTGRPYKVGVVRRPGDPAAMIEIACPALVDEATWDRAGARLAGNPSRLSGNPLRVRALTGKVRCPACGGRMTVLGSGKNTYVDKSGRTREYKKESRYACIHSRRQYAVTGVYSCSSASFMIRRTEEAVVAALLDAAKRPEAVAEAVAVYAQALRHKRQAQDRENLRRDAEAPGGGASGWPATPESLRRDLLAAGDALGALEARQSATVKAQIAGIIAGADAAAYAPAFAEIAAERARLKERHAALTRLLRGPQAGRKQAPERARPAPPADVRALALKALEDAHRVLTSDAVSGADKRAVIAALVDRVVCQPGGADVVFLPGVLPDSPPDRGPGESGPGESGPGDGGPAGSGRGPASGPPRAAPHPGETSSREPFPDGGDQVGGPPAGGGGPGGVSAETVRASSMILACTRICRVGRLPRLTRSTTFSSGGRDWIRPFSASLGGPLLVRLGVASFKSIRGALSSGMVSGRAAPSSPLPTFLGLRALRVREAGAAEVEAGSGTWEA